MKYEKIKYPDGQVSCKILDVSDPGRITERINSYEDLFFVRAIADAAHRIGVEDLRLTIPCLFGQRSDRRFSEQQSFDLQLIAEVINNCGFKEVNILDPHSHVATTLIDNSYRLEPYRFVDMAVTDINVEDLVLVSPDTGAYNKVWTYANSMSLPMVCAVKHRSAEGDIELKFVGDVAGKTCLIVDDLCDGGATFIALGKELKNAGADKVYLYVTHGLFSKGFELMKQYITHIYCTNSFSDIPDTEENDMVTQFKFL